MMRALFMTLVFCVGCKAKIVSINNIGAQYAHCDGSLHDIAVAGRVEFEALPTGGLLPTKLVRPRPLFIPDHVFDAGGAVLFAGGGAVGHTVANFQGTVRWGCKRKEGECIVFGPTDEGDADKDTGLIDIDAGGNNRSNKFDLICVKE
jgi:hypothetical protein